MFPIQTLLFINTREANLKGTSKTDCMIYQFEADKVSHRLNQGKMFGNIKNGRL